MPPQENHREIPPELDLQEEQFQDQDQAVENDSPLSIAPEDRKLVTHPYDFIIRSLKDQITDKTLILADKFQRRQVWDDTKASRLIESLVLNVPIPVCYFAELEAGAYSVIDGQQRLTAIYRYLENQFALRGLRVQTELNGKRFHQLDPAEQRLIKSRAIRCIVILRDSHPDIRFDVFERLNSGSVRLNPQELRNSMYRGPLNDLIRKLSESELFCRVRNVKTIDKRMRDCELILRFFAFHFNIGEYRGTLSRFLDGYLSLGNKLQQERLNEHEAIFNATIRSVEFVFGDSAFRRYNKDGRWENLINRAIYDVIMLSFARLDPSDILIHKEKLLEGFKGICRDVQFDELITSGTQTEKNLQLRLNKWRAAINEAGISMPAMLVGAAKHSG